MPHCNLHNAKGFSGAEQTAQSTNDCAEHCGCSGCSATKGQSVWRQMLGQGSSAVFFSFFSFFFVAKRQREGCWLPGTRLSHVSGIHVVFEKQNHGILVRVVLSSQCRRRLVPQNGANAMRTVVTLSTHIGQCPERDFGVCQLCGNATLHGPTRGRGLTQ